MLLIMKKGKLQSSAGETNHVYPSPTVRDSTVIVAMTVHLPKKGEGEISRSMIRSHSSMDIEHTKGCIMNYEQK